MKQISFSFHISRFIFYRYMDSPFSTTNLAAKNAATVRGVKYSCDDPKFAQPEWWVDATTPMLFFVFISHEHEI
jgi:hypothetical protein